MRTEALWCLTLFALSALVAPSISHAQPKPTKEVEGVVVSVDPKELIVDLGRTRGLQNHAKLRVYRRLEVRHPVSKKLVVDKFYIGSIKMTRVGDTLSIAKVWELEHPPKPGDFVVYGTPAVTPTPVTQTPKVKKPIEDQALDVAFVRSLGKPLTERIEIWETYTKAFPTSKHLPFVEAELNVIRGLVAQLRGASDERQARDLQAAFEVTQAARQEALNQVGGVVSGPVQIEQHQPLRINATLTNVENVKLVRALVRRTPEASYKTYELSRRGDHTWSLNLDRLNQTQGSVEYFLEAVDTQGNLTLLDGSADAPLFTEVVQPAPPRMPESNRSRISTIVEFVDFKTGDDRDEYLRMEAEFRYRLYVPLLSSFSMGVGSFQGRGAALEELKAGSPGTERQLNYGFLEVETRLHEFVGFGSRLLLGQESASDRNTRQGALGVGGQLRVGYEESTRLEVGAAFTQGIGNEGWIELTLDAIENIPMSASVLVTNLPVGADLGVSLNYGVGYQFGDHFKLTGRVGWNARTINDSGFAGGLGTEISW